jgi:hypothetical protein
MKAGGGSGKGKSFERKEAKFWGEWWQGSPFRRVPLSGGWDKVTDGECLAAGDLYIPPESDFPFCIECKKREGWSFEAILSLRCKAFWSWWEQTETEALRVGRLPLLVFSKNHSQVFVAFDQKHFWKEHLPPSFCGGFVVPGLVPEQRLVIMEVGVALVLFDSHFGHTTPTTA